MEQMIIFVYDTGFCQSEADDPQKAVLFFHPHWVTEQHKLALCGQLMGASHFCTTMFSMPSVLSLQSGKFVLKRFNQYTLCVGSDQTVPEWILHERFTTLQFLVQFYHRNFDTILTSNGADRQEFANKISQIMKTYIPILQFVVSSLGNVPTIQYPKSKNTAFLEAVHLLEACCASDGVLGGVILCHNRVLATQFDAETTKLLALTDPYKIKSCAESMATPFHLPVGVQVLRVYVQQKTYNEVRTTSRVRESDGKSAPTTKKPAEAKDYAKIFTVHEEEDGEERSVRQNASVRRYRVKRQSKPKPEITLLKERSKNFRSNHNISICSTPTVEKTFFHEELVSICSGKMEQKTQPVPSNFVPDLVQDAIKAKQKNNGVKYSRNRLSRMSMDDLMIDLTHKSYPIPMRYYSFGLPSMAKEPEQKKKSGRARLYKTIADPMNPLFRCDGVPVSKCLYNHCLDEHYRDYMAANIAIDSRAEFVKKKNLENTVKAKDIATTLNDRLEEPEQATKPEVVRREKNKVTNNNQKIFRKSLTLPLKPMSFDGNESSSVKNKVLHAITPSTPLITKLSLLALEEQELQDSRPAPPGADVPKSKTNSTTSVPSSKPSFVESELVPCGLFVCGLQDITILLLLDDGVEQNPELILSLWETSTTNLDRIEQGRQQNTDHLSSNAGGSSYSFLSMEPSWGTTERVGPWGNEELRTVGLLHRDMLYMANITELVVRNEDAVVYGYRCGTSETFYQQGGCSSVGLPTPADLMGTVILKARRRLERDHGVVLL